MEKVLSVGNVVSFTYPSANYLGAREKREKRLLQITEVKDMRREPIDMMTILRWPQLRRGTMLVTGIDLLKRAERSFYLESMADVHERSGLLDQLYEVQILERDSDPEIAFRGCALSALSFAREWLAQPLGLTVAIVPLAQSQ